jgi:hypothetical protein
MYPQTAALALHHLAHHAATKAPHALGESPSTITHGLIGVVIAFAVVWVIGRFLRTVFSPRRAD